MPASVIAAGAAGLHARVVRLHVRVRPDHGGHLAVEALRHRDLLARRLAVHVETMIGVRFCACLDELVDDFERIDGG
jgi:hypothetical protein